MDTRDKALSDIEITGLTADSREVKPGFLFAAMPGNELDGATFIPDALSRGAAALLVASDVDISNFEVPCITDATPRRRFAELAASYYQRQPETIVAVTGTSGKSSIVGFIRQIWRAQGINAGSIGTLGAIAEKYYEKAPHTTPEPATLHHLLNQMAEHGVDHLALEASSHGIDQARLDGVRIKAALFTNLSRDHLDYHHDTEDYFSAKAQLFDRLLPEGGCAIANIDSGYAEQLHSIAQARRHRWLTYGRMGKDKPDVGFEVLDRRPNGQLLWVDVLGEKRELLLPLVGEFQAENVMAAVAAVVALGLKPVVALDSLKTISGTKGRLELVAMRMNGGRIYVDYAHKPEAIRTALAALRPFTKGRLIIVFGCGGDRDQGKRPLMAKAAAKGSDFVIVTDDNPRSEDASKIRRQTLIGAPKAQEIGDRGDAIRTACRMLGADDVLLIAGKGHETGQEIAGRILPFDDAAQVRLAIQEIDGDGV